MSKNVSTIVSSELDNCSLNDEDYPSNDNVNIAATEIVLDHSQFGRTQTEPRIYQDCKYRNAYYGNCNDEDCGVEQLKTRQTTLQRMCWI